MSKYKCVIFDCDGVLVDSEALSNGVLTDLANQNGANLDLNSAIKIFKGCSMTTCIEKIESLIDKSLPDNFETEYRRLSFEAFKAHIKPINGVKEMLEQLDLPFCVASSALESKMRLNLELTGLLDMFEGRLFSCYTIQKWKPDPAVFLWAAETMGFKPEECLVIEDSYSGVTAALAGGFDVFGYTADDIHNQLKGYPTLEFDNMNQLISLIQDSK
ncbi:HAD-IA family hydrolase [Formosa sp. PL04]|uniref:HAD family hydrolase n=1 Tax=Formosa sp. PL04 TaxID=3081755 RepID=UPI0029814AA5|nr:HAD-IA family hydrolase [Formosa sp. PL04]MDW5290465.1 HAD-IA family hydrolase [Formosa sp. PL04]